jgi:serine/threonine protein kinase
LAKAFTNQKEPSASVENSPTLTIGPTEVDVILDTPRNMSPEQAKGKNVGKRGDIWAFGVVLYELLPGERLPATPRGGRRDRKGYFSSETGTVNAAVFTIPLRWNCTHIL